MNFEKYLDKHMMCRVVIVEKKFKNRSKLVPTLYCADHVKWLKYCTFKEADDLIQAGVENLGPLKF